MMILSKKSYGVLIFGKVCNLLWLLIHWVYRVQLEVRDRFQRNWKHVARGLSSCFPPYSYYAELAQLAQAGGKLEKLPRHIAFSLVEDYGGRDEKKGHEQIDLQLLARVISWAWVARIPVVSLYDYNGRIKRSYRELGYYVQAEYIKNFWAVKALGEENELPCIKFHNIPKINGYSNGVGSNGVKAASRPLHIVVFSHEDGKPDIVQTAKRLYLEHVELRNANSTSGESVEDDGFCKEQSVRSIDESKLDMLLNKGHSSWTTSTGVSSEPDVLLVLGSIQSTLGFLPWHIRLTEIFWLPKLDSVETRNLLSVLQKYAGCQQRFGT